MHDHDHDLSYHEIITYWWITFITALTLVLEVIGGFHTKSLALMSDSFHVAFDLSGDILALFIAYYVRFYPSRRKNKEIIRAWGGVVSSALLLVLVITITVDAFKKIFEPQEIKSWQMILYTMGGLLGNLLAFKILESRREDHITHETLMAHVHSDLIQSVAVVVIGTIILVTHWHLLDTVGTFFIAFWLGRISVRAFKSSVKAVKAAHL